MLPVALTTPPVVIFPCIALPVVLIVPVDKMLPKVALPDTDIALVAALNVNPELAPALPLAL